MSDTTLSKIQGIIAHQLKSKPERITPQARLREDLGADSLDALEIIMSLEEEFNVQIVETDARKMVFVQDILDYITKKTAA
jgi:acyl carrier protein